MLQRIRTVVIVVFALLAVTAAAVATGRWEPWTPAAICLTCTPDTDGLAAAGASDRGASPFGQPGSRNNGYSGSAAAGAVVPPALSGSWGSAGASAKSASGSRGWQPWNAHSGIVRLNAPGSGGPSASLGGMWRLVSFGRSSGAAHSSSGASTAAASTHKTPPVRKPAPTPVAHHSPSTGSTASPPSLSSAATVTAAPVLDPFHEHEVAPPAPFSPPSTSFNPGMPGSGGSIPHAGAGGMKVSATPEPASMVLFGSGLLGILGILRRRALI